MMEQLADKRIQRERDIPFAQISNIPLANDKSEDGSYDEDEEEEE